MYLVTNSRINTLISNKKPVTVFYFQTLTSDAPLQFSVFKNQTNSSKPSQSCFSLVIIVQAMTRKTQVYDFFF